VARNAERGAMLSAFACTRRIFGLARGHRNVVQHALAPRAVPSRPRRDRRKLVWRVEPGGLRAKPAEKPVRAHGRALRCKDATHRRDERWWGEKREGDPVVDGAVSVHERFAHRSGGKEAKDIPGTKGQRAKSSEKGKNRQKGEV